MVKQESQPMNMEKDGMPQEGASIPIILPVVTDMSPQSETLDGVISEPTKFPSLKESREIINFTSPQPRESFDPEREKQRRTPSHAQEFDNEDPVRLHAFANVYLNLLKWPSNRYHFTDIPQNVEEMKAKLSEPSAHGLAIYNALGEVIGFGTITDPEPDQSDTWAEKIVLASDLQRKSKRNEEEDPKENKGVGTLAIEKIMDWTFENPTHDGRKRDNIYAAIVVYVPNDERMDNALLRAGFHSGGTSDRQATIRRRTGEEKKRTIRFVAERDNWENRKFREMHEGTPHIVN